MSQSNFAGRIFRLCQKELKETIRDRRTIVTLLLMPLLLYPILSMALNRFLLSAGDMAEGFTICVASEEDQLRLEEILLDPRSMPPEAILKASGDTVAKFRVAVVQDVPLEELVEERQVDVAIEIVPFTALNGASIKILAHQSDSNGLAARRILTERMQWFRLNHAENAATQTAPGFRQPFDLQVVDVGEVESASMLGTIVPLVLVLMTITGAVYPAIDLTAGERERGTMEAVMASPVPRGYVLFSKYIAVVIVALLTALVNLTAMFTTLWAGGLLSMLTGAETFPWTAVLRILGLLVLFSSFYSALLLSLTSFAKSFKEAQAYLIPVMLISLAPAMLSLLPGADLSGALAIVPLVNIVLLARDVLSSTINPVGTVAAVTSTIAYAVAALSIASRLFGSDAVTRTSQQSIGSLFRRPKTASLVPSPQAATTMLALLVPIYFVVSNGLMRFVRSSDSIATESLLILNAAALVVTFGFVPFFAALLGRNQLSTTYRFRGSKTAGVAGKGIVLLGSILLGLGAWAFAHEAFVFADAIGIGGMSADKIEQAQASVEKMREASPLLLLAVFAVAPAVIEELCFRGYLFSSFAKVLTPTRTILVTGVLFGLFHVLTGSALLFERFVPSTLMGLLIGWVAYRTGSVLPGIVIHFVHNGLLNLVIYYQDQLSFLGADFESEGHLPPLWIAGASVIVLVGSALIYQVTRKPQVPEIELANQSDSLA